jgi:hypothetical protein
MALWRGAAALLPQEGLVATVSFLLLLGRTRPRGTVYYEQVELRFCTRLLAGGSKKIEALAGLSRRCD